MIEIRFEQSNNRTIALDEGNEIGHCKFKSQDGIWTVVHTIVDPDYRGQDIAMKLIDCLAEEARKLGINLTATCPYAVRMFKEPDYRDIAF